MLEKLKKVNLGISRSIPVKGQEVGIKIAKGTLLVKVKKVKVINQKYKMYMIKTNYGMFLVQYFNHPEEKMFYYNGIPEKGEWIEVISLKKKRKMEKISGKLIFMEAFYRNVYMVSLESSERERTIFLEII